MAAPQWLRKQLSGPSGLLARPMARLLNRINRQDYALALDALGARRGETVLELGFGGGIGVEALLDRGVRVLAAEPSVAMRARAHRRYAWALARGELVVWACGAEELPNRKVDRALSLNTVYFWRDIEAGFANLRRVVQLRLVLGIASPEHLRKAGFEQDGFRIRELDWYAERLRAAGFTTSIISAPSEDNAALLVGDAAG